MELERCEHCKKYISSVNLVMHVAHCQRNIQMCRTCGEPVSKVNWQEHQEDHKPVKCDRCGKEISKASLENHIANSCLKREVACVYCGLDMSFSELNNHEVYCGSRTEPCETCKKFVMIKDIPSHVCDGSGRSSSPTIEDVSDETVPCEFCNMEVPMEQLMKHESTCPVLREEEDYVEIIDDNTDTTSPRGRKRSHDEEIAEENFLSASDETTDCPGEDAKQDVIYALPCEICGELCPSDRLMDHQRECLFERENQGSSSRDEPIDVDEDDEGIWFNNLNLDDGPRFCTGHINEHFPRMDAFDLMARFHPFFANSLFDQGVNQRYYS